MLWTVAVILTAVAASLAPGALPSAAVATTGPFATLAAIIIGSALAGRLGAFRALARLVIRDGAPQAAAAASVLLFTALLAGLVNLDVAVVIAMPFGLEAASRHGLPAGRTAVAIVITANAASFLLPTANITTLLLLGRVPLPVLAYLRGSWLAWLLVVTVTAGLLTWWLARDGAVPANSAAGGASGGPARNAVLDLIPMFAAATAIRAILAAGVALHGGVLRQLAAATVLSCAADNLPAAAALHPAGISGLWAAALGAAIGPSLILTGSVAALIGRRLARDAGVTLSAWRYTAAGCVLVPAQLAAAVAGLVLSGTLH